MNGKMVIWKLGNWVIWKNGNWAVSKFDFGKLTNNAELIEKE